MKFLNYFEDKKLGIYFKHLLENTFECQVILAENSQDFLKAASGEEYNFYFISSDESFSDSDLSKIGSHISKGPGIYACKNSEFRLKLAKNVENEKISFLENLTDIQLTLKKIADKLSIVYNLNEVGSSFVPIRPDYLEKVNHVNCDIFIKLSDEKYLKFIKQDSEINSEERARIQKKNIDFLYIRINEFELFLNDINAFGSEPIENLSKEEIAKDLSFAHDVFYQLSSQFGLNSKAVNYANRSVELLYSLIDQDDDLKSVWSFLIKKKNFLSEHSLMVAYLSNAILSHTSYSNDNNSIKLSLAALLHDVTIKADNVLELELDNGDRDNYSRRELEAYRAHVYSAVDILNKFEDVPLDIDKILLNHHEKYDGSGFPRGVGWSKIPLLAAIFIVAHEFVVTMFKENYSEEELVKFIELKKLEYLEGSFKEIILALEKIRQK